MIMVYVLQPLVDEDEVEMVRLFSTSKKAAEQLVSLIDDMGLCDEEGEELDMDVVAAWDGNEQLNAGDSDCRIVYRLYAVELDK